MKFVSLLFIMALIFSANVFSQSNELQKVFDDGNKLYLEQKYNVAIAKYESIVKNGFESGAVYFNLGNSYYKSGNIARAILNYERAKKLLPADEDVDFNLQLANVQVIDKIDAIPELFIYRWLNSLLTIFSTTTMLWLMYLLFIVALISFSLFLFSQSYALRRYSLMTGLVLTGFLTAGIANYLIQSHREANTEFAIVLTDVANIKSAPDNKGNDQFVIHRGLKVQVLDAVNNWKKIRLVDGKVGWIPLHQIEII